MAARWYIVHAYSNFEKKVAESIKEKARQKRGLEASVRRRSSSRPRRWSRCAAAARSTAERKFFPGYVHGDSANLTDEAYHLIKNTPKVTGFLRLPTSPSRFRSRTREAERILGPGGQEGVERPKAVGQLRGRRAGPRFRRPVRVVQRRGRGCGRCAGRASKVEVSIFGRATPVELEYGQVEKV